MALRGVCLKVDEVDDEEDEDEDEEDEDEDFDEVKSCCSTRNQLRAKWFVLWNAKLQTRRPVNGGHLNKLFSLQFYYLHYKGYYLSAGFFKTT